MQHPTRPILVAAGLAALIVVAGCSTVELRPKGREVEVLSQERTAQCDKLGQTRVSVATKVGFIARGESKIRQDLQVLARNSAADMGGDTVTALTEIQDGKQTYGVYDCIPGQ